MKTWLSKGKLRKSAGFSHSFSGNKGLGVEVSYNSDVSPFYLDCGWSRETDHAGVQFNICIFGAQLSFEYSDSRHWNANDHRWYYEGEEAKMHEESSRKRAALLEFYDRADKDKLLSILKDDLRLTDMVAIIHRHDDLVK